MFKRTIGLMILLMFVLGTTLCFAEEYSLGCDDYLISAKVIQEKPDEIIKTRIKGVRSNKTYSISTYLINKDDRSAFLKTTEYYNEDGSFDCSFTNNDYSKCGESKYIDNLVTKIIQYMDEKGE